MSGAGFGRRPQRVDPKPRGDVFQGRNERGAIERHGTAIVDGSVPDLKAPRARPAAASPKTAPPRPRLGHLWREPAQNPLGITAVVRGRRDDGRLAVLGRAVKRVETMQHRGRFAVEREGLRRRFAVEEPGFVALPKRACHKLHQLFREHRVRQAGCAFVSRQQRGRGADVIGQPHVSCSPREAFPGLISGAHETLQFIDGRLKAGALEACRFGPETGVHAGRTDIDPAFAAPRFTQADHQPAGRLDARDRPPIPRRLRRTTSTSRRTHPEGPAAMPPEPA